MVGHARQLTDARTRAPARPPKLVLIPGADHGNVPETVTLERYRQALTAFIEAVLGGP